MIKDIPSLPAICILALIMASACSTPPQKPNIVFILADDMGYSDPGCYGAEIVQTPNIDMLAENGLRFANFYNTGRCWPTRTSLLSGYYPHQVLADPMPGVDYSPSSVQPATDKWLPSILRDQGYRTYHSGKWHVVRKVPAHSDISHSEVGFDHSYHTEDGRHLRPHHLWEDGKEIPVPEPGSGYDASVDIVDHAIAYLEEHKQLNDDQPFFEYIAFITPHFPLQALQKDIDMYRKKFLMGWDEIRKLRTENRKELGFDVHEVNPLEPERYAPWNLSPEELVSQIDPAETGRAVSWEQLTREQQEFQATKMAIHAAMVSRMDREIGRYMDALEELGYKENTIVFFCSDNGASTEIMNRADKHTIGEVPGSADTYLCLGPGWSSAANTPFRLHKTWVHEGGIASPMVVHWPGGIKDRNAFRKIPAHIIDMAPTILELAGAEAEELDGRHKAPGISLVPFLNKDELSERPPIFFHHENKKALRDGDWKITTIEENGPWELYNLAEDRGETRNLAEENPEQLQELVSLWEAQRNEIIEQLGARDARGSADENYHFDFVDVNTPGTSSLRAICAVDEKIVWASGSQGKLYLSLSGGQNWSESTVPGCEDTEFRSLHAWDASRALVFDVSPKGRAFLTTNGGESWEQVYKSPEEGAFFNSLKFANESQGLAISDPIDEKVFVIKTEDGGKNWKRLPNLPLALSGEINFAASNTCIEYLPSGEIYIVTGGSKSRVLSSNTHGESWEFVDTPVITGESAGLFSIKFTAPGKGVAVGGDFNDPERKGVRAIYTEDGGKNWIEAVSMPAAYRSCVVSMNDDLLFATGKTGCDYSADHGKNWVPIAYSGYYSACAVPGRNILYLAGANGRVARVTVRSAP